MENSHPDNPSPIVNGPETPEVESPNPDYSPLEQTPVADVPLTDQTTVSQTEVNQPESLNQVETKQDSVQTPAVKTAVPLPPRRSPKFILVFFMLLFFLIGLAVLVYARLYKTPATETGADLTPTASPQGSSDTSPEPTSAISTPVGNELSVAHNNFGFNLLSRLTQESPNKNIVISPTSIELDFSMLVNGAKNDTLSVMQKTLGLSAISLNSLNADSSDLIDGLKNPDPKVVLSVVNSIWTRKDITASANFLDTNSKYYHAEIQSLDFKNSQSAKTINTWVSQNTQGKIPTIIDPPIDQTQVMFLINAIYFKGQWAKSFDSKLTLSKPFTLADKTSVNTDLMSQTDDFAYYAGSDIQLIRLPYGDYQNLAMYVLLPKSDLGSVLGQLNLSNWTNWQAKLAIAKGTIILPKFKIVYGSSLKNTLINLGMGSAFLSTADFSAIAPDVYISDVLHKTYIEVNEEGTVAAAATGIGILGAAPSNNSPFYMEVNKPFFFTIEDKTTGAILFTGLVYNPTQ